jgi:hypothetical protein
MARGILTNRVDLSRVVKLGDPEEMVVLFKCPLLSAATACDTIRDLDRELERESITSVYLRRGARWVKLEDDARLTLTRQDTSVILNPSIFRVERERAAYKGSAPRVVHL